MKRFIGILILIIVLNPVYANDFMAGFTIFDDKALMYKPDFKSGTIDRETIELFHIYDFDTWPTMRKMVEQYIKIHGTMGKSTNLLRTAISVLRDILEYPFPAHIKYVQVWFLSDGKENTLKGDVYEKALEELKVVIAEATLNVIPIIIYAVEVRHNNSSYRNNPPHKDREGLAELKTLSGNDPARFFQLPDFTDENSALNRTLDQISMTREEYACYFVIDRSPSLAGAGNDVEKGINIIRDKVLAKSGDNNDESHVENTFDNLTVTGREFINIQGGKFIMGSNDHNHDSDESPAHEREVPSFMLGANLITEPEYYRIMGPPEMAERHKNSKKPITGISWYDAVKYCNKRSELEKKQPAYKIQDDGTVSRIPGANGYFLPSEKQFQFAARAGATNLYHTGPTLLKEEINLTGELMDVGAFKPNSIGIYDIIGSLRQWTSDVYDVYRPENDYNPPATGATVVCYGASFRDRNSLDRYRITYRFHHEPGFSDEYLGFRVALPE